MHWGVVWRVVLEEAAFEPTPEWGVGIHLDKKEKKHVSSPEARESCIYSRKEK